MYYRLEHIKDDLDNFRETGRVKGKEVGWDWDKLPLTLKEGTTTYIGAPPASGKTEFWLEILINTSCLHGWKHVIFSPETGDAKEIFAELCNKFIGKSYLKNSENPMSEAERVKAEYFVNEHFIIIDPNHEDITIFAFYELVDKIEKELEITINTTTIDPWNELVEEFVPDDLGREDKYLSRILGMVRKNARETGRHNCVINHVRDQAPVTKDGVTYFPMPSARDLAGGQVWFRKGLTVIMIWRPPFGLTNEHSVPYEMNEVHIKIAKTKPKGTSKVGTYIMFLDRETYQYYALDEFTNKKYYANRGDYSIFERPVLIESKGWSGWGDKGASDANIGGFLDSSGGESNALSEFNFDSPSEDTPF